MRIIEIIEKKRTGEELAEDEIAYVVEGFVSGRIPDAPIAALLMAIMFRGMTEFETATLTAVMAQSGTVLDLSDLGRPVVDRHSSGGVGDKTTILTVPIVSAAGLLVPMISGRSLGHTGGTLDKLESIPGFRTNYSFDEFRQLVSIHGAAIISQNDELAPADRAMYALRDATGSVVSAPLIASSVMSKKLAEGLNALVLDVKVGSGAFLKDEAEARQMAEIMCAVGERNGTRTEALLTRMDQPLGRAVGNGVEVAEAIAALKGEGPKELVELSLDIAAHMIALGMMNLGFTYDLSAARNAASDCLSSGRALERFRRIVEAQGGDPRVIDNPGLLPRAPVEYVVTSNRPGYVARIDAEQLGWAMMGLGAGRSEDSPDIDRGVGLLMDVRLGDEVRLGDPLCRVLGRDDISAALAGQLCKTAILVDDAPPEPSPIVIDLIGNTARH